ncbi:hypothetical protein BGY98DRAFT_934140 [Russula aff. rugulosa BPL654]|nr:hypothetical protein BGY98DRAFT_934140 [Russula aff. rugulosa BPL654]
MPIFTSPTTPPMVAENDNKTFTVGVTHVVSPILKMEAKLEDEVDVEGAADMMPQERTRPTTAPTLPAQEKDTINWLESTRRSMFQLDFVEWIMVLWGKGRAVMLRYRFGQKPTKGRGFRKSCISISLLADANVARDLRNLKQLGDWLLPVLGDPCGGEIEVVIRKSRFLLLESLMLLEYHKKFGVHVCDPGRSWTADCHHLAQT